MRRYEEIQWLAYENSESQQEDEGSPPAVFELTAIAHATENGCHEEAHEGTKCPYQRHVLVIDADFQKCWRNEGGLCRVREFDSHYGR